MKSSTYMTRALRSKDGRYAIALARLGYAEPLKNATPTADPLDHDGDGRKGGSTAPEPDEALTALRAEYQALAGKRAFSGWDAEALQAKITDMKGAE
ncbi:hypothetical protein [Neorhizobium sp. NCHU2750]|uniref:hypothetical protein n=1 Tax=Neorhizobium sp. NCHU2750 TaxID=1825976 RepID=UPI000E707BBC|nr:hypothetical protein NCHU2750_06220 [Neorhizobium sp. NCHU2750]